MSASFGNHQNQEPPESLQKARSSNGGIVVCVISIYAMYASKSLALSIAQQLQLNALMSTHNHDIEESFRI